MVCARPYADGVQSIQIALPIHGVKQGILHGLVITFQHGSHLWLGAEVAAADECEGVRMAGQDIESPAHQVRAGHAGAVDTDQQQVPGGRVPDRVVDGASR